MSTQSSLMDMPQEILVMIFNIHFSNITIKIRQCLRRSRRKASSNPQGPSLAFQCMNVLLVNKALHAIAKPSFNNNVTVWSDGVFKKQHPHSLSWICSQVPWTQTLSVSGGKDELLANRPVNALVHRWIPFHRLREISTHYNYATWTTVETPGSPTENPMIKMMRPLAEVCQVGDISLHAFHTVYVYIHINKHDDALTDWFKCSLKVVIRRDLSMELHELWTDKKSLYAQHRDQLEQVWKHGLPIREDLESAEDGNYRPRSVEIERREA